MQTEELLLDGNEYDKQVQNVSELLQQSNTVSEKLKESIIDLATILETSYLKNNMISNIRHIYSIICMTLKSKNTNLSNYFINKAIYQALEKYPQFFITVPTSKESEETEENKLFAELVTEYTRKISKIQISRLTQNQAEKFIKYLDKVSRAKINEAKHEYDISIKDIDRISSPLDEMETEKITTKRETDTAQFDDIYWKLQEFRNLVNKLLNYCAYYHAPSSTIKEKMLDSLERSIERLQLIIDMKDKATFEDWSNISLISDEYKVNAGRMHKFKTSYCKYCKDIDTDLDPEGKKGIYAHMEMKKEYNENYDPRRPYADQPIYIFRCPRCKGTESLEISLTAERIKSNYRHIIEVNTEHINQAGFDNFAEVFGKSCVQVFKINSSKDISNKLLSKK